MVDFGRAAEGGGCLVVRVRADEPTAAGCCLDLAETSARHCRLNASNSASWSLDVSGEDILGRYEGKGDVEGLASGTVRARRG